MAQPKAKPAKPKRTAQPTAKPETRSWPFQRITDA
jgi:hypothetical protein